MRINPKTTLFGHPALKIRDALKGLPNGSAEAWAPFRWDKHLPDADRCQRQEIEGRMLKAGFIERCPHHLGKGDKAYYTLTERGMRLAGASARLFRRKTAERVLNQVIDRARAINAGDYAYDVRCIVVFGSYLSGRPKVGDLDLAISLVRRAHPGKDWMQYSAHFRQRAPSGVSFLDELCWPEIEVWRFLKSRSHVVSIMSLDADNECVVTNGPYKVVFGKWKPTLEVDNGQANQRP
jgi:hypothetical protein